MTPARPRPWLVVLAHVGPASADDELADRRAAADARLAGTPVHEEPLLRGAVGAVEVTKVVDRRPLGSIPACSESSIAWRNASNCPPAATRGPQRVDSRPEQRLVRVDVADAGDPALVEDERLDRRRAPARDRPQVIRGELGRQRLDPEAGVQILVPCVGAVDDVAGTEPPWVDVDQPMAVVELDPDPRVQSARPLGPTGTRRSSAGGRAGTSRPRAPRRGTCRCARPLDPTPAQLVLRPRRAPPGGSSGDRGSRRAQRAPLQMRRELAADRLDFGELGHGPYL